MAEEKKSLAEKELDVKQLDEVSGGIIWKDPPHMPEQPDIRDLNNPTGK